MPIDELSEQLIDIIKKQPWWIPSVQRAIVQLILEDRCPPGYGEQIVSILVEAVKMSKNG